MTTKTIVTISISSDLLALIDRAAALEARSRSSMICRILEYALTDRISKEGKHE